MTLNLIRFLGIFDTELRCVLLVFLYLLLALVAIGLAHTILHGLRTCRDVLSTKRTVLDLFLILLLDTTQLIDSDSTLHQLSDYLLARYTFGVLLNHIIHNLIVGHSRLCPAYRDSKGQTSYNGR